MGVIHHLRPRLRLDKAPRRAAISGPMASGFDDIAGVAWDGSGRFTAGEITRALRLPGGIAPSRTLEGEDMRIAGLGAGESPEGLALCGNPEPAGVVGAWAGTRSVSAFGDGARGGFAAAKILDEDRRIWLTRDHFGQQPLYYAEAGGATVFSTSLTWMVQAGLVETDFDADVTAELLQLQFLTQAPSPFKGIRRVMPGETIVIERGRIVDRLRRPIVPLSDRRPVSREGALDALDDYFNELADRVLERDGHTGVVVMGDVASTALAVALARRARSKLSMFIPDWLDRTTDASAAEQGAALARSLGFDPVTVSLTGERFWERLPHVAAKAADPVGDYITMALDGLAEQALLHNVRLVLPTGGQELFGAYGRYRSALRPLFVGGRAMRSRGHLQGLGSVPDGPGHWRDGLISTENKLRGGGFTRLQRLQLLDLATWLPNDVLLNEHQMLVRAGVDVERPYLSSRFSGFVFALSDHLKISPRKSGSLLHQWLERTFPTAFDYLDHARAGLPLGNWISPHAPQIGPEVDRVLAGAGLLPNGYARTVFDAMTKGANKRIAMAAWQLLYLATWHRVHVSHIPPEEVWSTASATKEERAA